MGSTRALFASIGVSVSLVAAAALSLFAVSVVIAFGGWSAGMGESEAPSTVVFATTTAQSEASSPRRAAPVVLRAPAQRPERRAPLARPRAVSKPAGDAAVRVVRHPVVTHGPTLRPQTVRPEPAATPPAAAPKRAPPSGDAVRRLGDDLSSVAQNTGKALGEVTAPLAPPVSSAVQKVLDVVAEALQRTTNGLGGTLDKLGQRR
jgi:hypothetical protein